jgi:hypothetical protein
VLTATPHLPSVRAPSTDDEHVPADEPPVLTTRRQIAIVRTLADELERCLDRGRAALALREQLVEELTRLGCRSLEAAADLAKRLGPDPAQSGARPVRALAAD